MTAKNQILLAALVLLPLAGGCGSRFAGEWVQESAVDRTGMMEPLDDGRRLAIQFTPPSTVRLGSYSDAARAVEDDSVASSDYQTIQNRSVALFGAYIARVEDGQLVTYIGAREVGRFRKLKGQSVFPPLVRLPQLVRAEPSAADGAPSTPDASAVVVAE